MIIYLIIILIFLILWTCYHNESIEEVRIERFSLFGDKKTFNPDKIEFPFKNFATDENKIIKIIAITAPFRTDEHREWYEKCKNLGYEFTGISSYSEFPAKLSNPHEDRYHEKKGDNYENMVKTWLHCFRNPNKYLKSNLPRMLWSESDTICPKIVKPNKGIEKKYDLIYICLDDSTDSCVEGWQAYNRNWELAKKCFSKLCQSNKNIKVLIVGRTKCKVKFCNDQIKNIPFQPTGKFLEYMNKSKIIYVPNVADASPRVLCQALCCDLRCLVNYDLVGGWKYVNQETGEFFHDEDDFIPQCEKIIKNYQFYNPREWYEQNYGPDISGVILLNFLKEHYPNVDYKGAKYLKIRW